MVFWWCWWLTCLNFCLYYYCILIINPYIYLPICVLLIYCYVFSYTFYHIWFFSSFFNFYFANLLVLYITIIMAYIFRFMHWFILIIVVNWPPSYVVSFLVFFNGIFGNWQMLMFSILFTVWRTWYETDNFGKSTIFWKVSSNKLEASKIGFFAYIVE